MSGEQRKYTRKALQVEFRGRDVEGTGLLLFEAADLSAGGSFLKSDLLLETGEQLALEFFVPGVPQGMKAHARVAWVRRFPEAGEPAGMGVEFLSMSEADRAILTAYLGRLGEP